MADNTKAMITRFPTPLNDERQFNSDDEKIEYIADKFKDIMVALGLDLSNDSLKRTPYRVAKMYVKEIFSGLDPKSFPEIRFFEKDFDHQKSANMVFVKLNFSSFCEHHFVPMLGTVYIGYLPKDRIIGLSKLGRVVRFFSQRPQLQERLTSQINDSLSELLGTDDIAVSITAKHFCMIARGIEDSSSHTTTNVINGRFESDIELRREFFEAVNR